MYKYASKSDKFVDRLVNMTGDKIRVYEWSSGDIKKFYPVNIKLPETPIYMPEHENYPVFFVLEEDEIKELKNRRTLDDIAVISNRSIGRNGKEISYLVWAKDMSTHVHLYRYPTRPPIASTT